MEAKLSVNFYFVRRAILFGYCHILFHGKTDNDCHSSFRCEHPKNEAHFIAFSRLYLPLMIADRSCNQHCYIIHCVPQTSAGSSFFCEKRNLNAFCNLLGSKFHCYIIILILCEDFFYLFSWVMGQVSWLNIVSFATSCMVLRNVFGCGDHISYLSGVRNLKDWTLFFGLYALRWQSESLLDAIVFRKSQSNPMPFRSLSPHNCSFQVQTSVWTPSPSFVHNRVDSWVYHFSIFEPLPIWNWNKLTWATEIYQSIHTYPLTPLPP